MAKSRDYKDLTQDLGNLSLDSSLGTQEKSQATLMATQQHLTLWPLPCDPGAPSSALPSGPIARSLLALLLPVSTTLALPSSLQFCF